MSESFRPSTSGSPSGPRTTSGPVRDLPEVHGGREVGQTARRNDAPLGRRDRRPEKEWDAKITEQAPDERIAWTSTNGAHNAGVVTFHRLDEGKSG